MMEVLVATTLVVLIFMIAGFTLNRLVLNTLSKKRVQLLQTRLWEIEYLYNNHKLSLPLSEDFQNWHIELSASGDGTTTYQLKATHKSGETINKKFQE
ncbi:MAG: hypothetical protein U1C58_03195 [Flavobacteriaceae bacterium]|nr:hypothetical protein [Flavobacteriaceae bacterium]